MDWVIQPAEARQGAKRSHSDNKDASLNATRYLLALPPTETRHMVEQVKAYLNAMQNPKNPLHYVVKEEKGRRLDRPSRTVQALLRGSAARNLEKPMQKYKMLVETNSKPHDIVVYTNGSATRG